MKPKQAIRLLISGALLALHELLLDTTPAWE